MKKRQQSLLVCALMKLAPKNLKAILLLEGLRSIQTIIMKPPWGRVAVWSKGNIPRISDWNEQIQDILIWVFLLRV